MNEKKHIERAPRIPLDVEVNCNNTRFVYSKNISETGIALISEEPLDPNQFVHLKFFLPGNPRQINVFAKVVRTDQVSDHFYEIGLVFWDVAVEDKTELEKFFKHNRA